MSHIKKYTKKPVEIEAIQLTPETAAEIREWSGAETFSALPMRVVSGLLIKTLEGDMIASYGDYIIKGIKGEFYPCKPDIFEASYDESSEWAKVSDIQAGSKVTVWGIPCIGLDGIERQVLAYPTKELFIPCEEGQHSLDGQIDGEYYIGIKLV